jgi:hypothetical protein
MFSWSAGIYNVLIFGFGLASIGDAVAQNCVPPPQSLVSWWDADGASGTTVSDLKGGNPGTITGGVKIARGQNTRDPRQPVSEFHFDGKSGLISMGNSAFQFGRGAFSLEASFLWDGGGSPIGNIIRKSNYPTSSPGAGYWIRLDRGAQLLEFFVGETVGIPDFPRALITAPINPGERHHVIGTKESAGKMNLFVDGKQAGAATIAPNFSVNADTPFTLGAWDDPYLPPRERPREFFSGYIDDVAVYNNALTPNDARALFNPRKCRGGGR